MRRSFLIVAVCIVLVRMFAVPALANVDSSPNAAELADVTCPEAGLFFEAIWVASPNSLASHDLEGNTVGVAKSLYFTDSEGTPGWRPSIARAGVWTA